MKALKILGIVFGIILLLTGGALLAGSALAGKGNDLISEQMAKQGLSGPAQGTVTDIVDPTNKIYSVTFTDDQGAEQSAQAYSSLPSASAVGDKVSVYYQKDDPSVAVIAAIPGAGTLDDIGSGLRIGGIACLIVGALMLIGGIVGLKMGKKTPALTAGPYGAGQPPNYPNQQQYAPPPPPPGQGYQPPPSPAGYQPQQYGSQGWQPQQPAGQGQPPGQGQPLQPGQGQQYPQQPGQGQQYPPQSGQGQAYPPQGQQYPPPPGQGQAYPPQGPPSAQ